MNSVKIFFRNLWYSFPVQLFLLSVRKHFLLSLLWLFLYLILIKRFGASVGTPFFLLDPEFLGQVGYLSFALVGIGFTMFYVSWNLAMYMLHSYRFPFLASTENPLATFFINNSLIPLGFIVIYIYKIVQFQREDELSSWIQISMDVFGFIAGFILIILVTVVYFQLVNRNARKVLLQENDSITAKRRKIKRTHFNEEMNLQSKDRVDFFVSMTGHIRHTRSVAHYNKNLTRVIFRYHHFTAFLGLILSSILLFVLGFWVENPVFQIPTASSAFIFFSIIISFVGVILYWGGNWGEVLVLGLIIILNAFSKYGWLSPDNRASGIQYDTLANYSLQSLEELSDSVKIQSDIIYFKKILKNWKNTCASKGILKPKLVIVNSSGGGLRAGMFSSAILQKADSLTNGSLYPQIFLMSGASGGMFGLTAIREQILNYNTNRTSQKYSHEITMNVGKDLLNPMFANGISNDMFFPFHRTEIKGIPVFRDRGVMLEKQLVVNNNGGGFEKSLAEYREAEFKAQAPLIIWHFAVINDSRKFFVSPHPISFLMKPIGKYTTNKEIMVDGIDYGKFFENQNSYNTTIASINRMNATFPFVLPNPQLPSDPPTFIMDGGVLDNFGNETGLRFLNTFKDWIIENTSGVVILQIRDTEKDKEIEPMKNVSALGKFFDPIGILYNNLENVHDSNVSQELGYLNEALKGKLNIVHFEYINEVEEKKAAMSFHLTEKNKKDILESVTKTNNQNSFNVLISLLE